MLCVVCNVLLLYSLCLLHIARVEPHVSLEQSSVTSWFNFELKLLSSGAPDTAVTWILGYY